MNSSVRSVRRGLRTLWPQWARTLAVVALWCAASWLWVGLVATYPLYPAAHASLVGLAIPAAILTHLYPPRTPPWRTVAWMAVITAVVGMVALTRGWDRYALTAATVTGYAILAGRANSNMRRLMHVVGSRLWGVPR